MASPRTALELRPARKLAAQEQARNARKSAYQNLVIEAAGSAFARQGIPQTKMEDLAYEAGISLGTLYSVYLTYFMERPDYLRMYLDDGANWGVRNSMDRESRRAAVWADGVAQLASIFERGIADGVFEPGSPNRLARVMLAMQQVVLADWFEDGMSDSAEEPLNEVEVLLRRTFCTLDHRQA